MTNREIADLFSITASLMELHLENEFKSKALRNASFTISKLDQPVCDMDLNSLSLIKGIGKSISGKVVSVCSTGQLDELTELLAKTPSGILELLEVKGLGPKKVASLWRGLEIQSPGELLYACNENRLIALKGFGEKSQSEIKKNLEFMASQKGYYHYAKAEKHYLDFLAVIRDIGIHITLVTGGEFRRCCEVVRDIHLLTDASAEDITLLGRKLLEHGYELDVKGENTYEVKGGSGPLIRLNSIELTTMNHFLHTGPNYHVDQVVMKLDGESIFESEDDIYRKVGLPFIEPEMRDLENCFQIKESQKNSRLINMEDIKGCLHNHSTYSDGASTLKEMAKACIELGLQYLGMCDHSRSAFYAGGLSIEDVAKQQSEIDSLNAELHPFKIFKGIESDILADGSLDYPDEVLKSFDIIVASIHSGLSMSEDKATERIIKAIENPYTSILGHPTGRLLLSRKGYPIDHRKVLEACASNGVAIELNAHPYRLDLDWRFLRLAMELDVPISINPDAHHTKGISDMRYGVLVARKAGVPPSAVLNTKTLTEFEIWLGL